MLGLIFGFVFSLDLVCFWFLFGWLARERKQNDCDKSERQANRCCSEDVFDDFHCVCVWFVFLLPVMATGRIWQADRPESIIIFKKVDEKARFTYAMRGENRLNYSQNREESGRNMARLSARTSNVTSANVNGSPLSANDE